MKYRVVNKMVSFQTVFVTVGTTKFDSLMEVMNTEYFQRILQQRFGTTRLVVQFGKSKTRPSSMYSFTMHDIFFYSEKRRTLR